MTFALFEDQVDLVDRVRQSMRRYKSVLMQSCTGSGKTQMAAAMIKSALSKGSRSLFVVPRRELLKQTAETFQSHDIPFGVVSAGYTPNPFAKVQLATVGTLARRLDKAPNVHVVFVDESHYGSAELARIIAHYKAQGAWIVGLSATPWKMSGEGLGMWYDHIELGLSMRELIERGRLSQYRMFAPSAPDLSGVKVTNGEYSKGQLASRMEGDTVLIGDAVKHYKAHGMGKLNVGYCTSIKHAEIVTQAFKDRGVPAATITGEMDDAERSLIVKAFARREILSVQNVDLLTFGFDLSSAAQMDVTIESMSDLRPTKSLSLQMQKVGRVLRRKDFPALIFDHAANVQRHGMPDDDRDWTLDDREKQKGGNSEPTIPVRQCPTCYWVARPFAVCPNCGHVMPVQSRMVEEVEGDLSEITSSGMTPRQMQGSMNGLDDLIALGHQRGYKNPAIWAAKVMSGRMAGRR